MAIKKKVTYSVQYVAGTDTLTTQLNLLLQDIVSLILSQNTGLTVLDTITVGSSRWTGAPLYDTRPSNLYYADYNNRHYESDVVFIGTNENNVCLSLGFFDGQLVVAMNMTPAVEKMHTDVWSSRYGLSSPAFYATGKASRWYKDVDTMTGNYSIPYSVINNAITMSVIYWSTQYSRGYSFVTGGGQSDGVDLVIFPTEEGNGVTGLGAAIWSWGTASAYRNALKSQILAFSFSENLSNNLPDIITSNVNPGYAPTVPGIDMRQTLNARYDWRAWFGGYNDTTSGRLYKFFACMHSLCGSTGRGSDNYTSAADIPNVNSSWDIPSPEKFISALMLAYNLPYLTPGQAYVRKMRIPGWNPSCKGEIYLLWSPVTTNDNYKSGDIVEVGSKSYAIITTGAVVWAARVS